MSISDFNDFEQRRARMAAMCRYDPLRFAENAWAWGEGQLTGMELRAWQTVALDDIAQHLMDPSKRFMPFRLAIASGHGIGKSALTGILTTWALACFKDPRILITANTETQLMTKTSPEVGQWVRTSAFGDLFSIETMSIKLSSRPEQHRADLVTNSEHRPEAFAGLHAHKRIVLVLMDEASSIPDVIWTTIQGALTDEDTILLWIVMGNPTQAVGMFRECFRENRKLWKTYQIDSRTVEGTNKQALQEIVDQYGEHSDQAKSRVKGQFPSISSNQFIPTPYLDQAFGRHLRPEQYDFAPVTLTVDPAWEGDDDMVIGKLQGLRFDILDVIPKNTNDVTIANKLSHLEDVHEADAVFIDAGYGTGIYSAGVSMGRDWRLVWFGEKAPDPGFLNMRAYMASKARDWLLSGGAIPPDHQLYQELAAIATKPHAHGLVQLESKAAMKKRLPRLGSPNRADALFLGFAHPVVKKAHHKPGTGGERLNQGNLKPVITNETYNPY